VLSMARACSAAGGNKVKGECLAWDYFAKGGNPDRKSVVPQQVGGLGLRLSSSCKNFQRRKSKKDIYWKRPGPQWAAEPVVVVVVVRVVLEAVQ
jgi:hypothetical protein